jgi:GH25 family lysozyme M1 (1,4-beta-N-acetylmuramidase)
MIIPAKDTERAKRIGRKHGRVLSCEKVDVSYYLNKIEYLKVTDKPIKIVYDKGEEYILNEALELSRPTKDYSDKIYSVEVVDKE